MAERVGEREVAKALGERSDDELFDGLREALRASRAEPPEARDAPPPALAPGSRFAGHAIVRELHRGGQGVVYEALESASGERVALKLLLRGSHAGERERLRFEREVRIAASLAHPNVVPLFASGCEDGWPWCSMELVDGSRLDEHVARARPRQRERLALFLAICEGVAHAHERGVVHRDLKPSNVLVSAAGVARVLDFGLARSFDEILSASDRLTRSGEFVGTLAYAAPEQLSGEGAEPDARADVYALGVVLYELLTGEHPIPTSGTLGRRLRDLATAEPRDARALDPTISKELWASLSKALARDPKRRYAHAGELALDLRRYLSGHRMHARAPRAAARAFAWMRRRRRVLLAAAGTACACGALLVGVDLARRVARERAAASELRRVFQELVAASPSVGMEAGVPLLDVLRETESALSGEVLGDPALAAAVRLRVGETWLGLFTPYRAEEALRAAVEGYRALGAEGTRELARALALYGEAASALGRTGAVDALRESLQLAEQGGGSALETRVLLARALFDERGLQAADEIEALLEPALAAPIEAGAAGATARARAAHALADLRAAGGREVEARALLEDAAALFDTLGGGAGRHGIACELELARRERAEGDHEAARARVEVVAERVPALCGLARAEPVLEKLAWRQLDAGDAPGGELLMRRALEHELRELEEKTPEQRRRARALTAEVESGDALAPVFALLRELEGEGAYEITRKIDFFAEAWRLQGRGAAAEPLLREGLRIRCRELGGDCPFRLEALEQLGRLLVESERSAEAESALVEALAIRARTDDLTGDRAVALYERLGRCRWMLDLHGAAEQALLSAEELAERDASVTDAARRPLWSTLAAFFDATGRGERAELYRRRIEELDA